MRKVKTEEIKTMKKLLSKLETTKCTGKSKIFFPIETEKTIDVDNFQLSFKDTNKGAAGFVQGGLVACNEKDFQVCLGYGSLEYSPKLNYVELAELVGVNYSKKDKELLKDLECYLVRNDYILELFEF